MPNLDSGAAGGYNYDAKHHKFTGKERDTESGLDNFGARYDSSSFGRFMTPDSPKFSEKADPQSWNLYSYVANNPVTRIDPTGHNWFEICATGHCQWEWHKGNRYNGMKSDFTHLLLMQKTGEKTRDGATVLKLTLFGNSDPAKSKPLAQGIGYSRGSSAHYRTTKNGDYEINLNVRGGPADEHMLPDGGLSAFAGIQQIGRIFKVNGEDMSFQGEWGDLRANLNTTSGSPTHFYLHGKYLYFTEGRTYTHGCTTEPDETVLKTLFQLDPRGVGEGAKNGRVLVNVSGQ